MALPDYTDPAVSQNLASYYPAYYGAADYHNIGNSNRSWFDPEKYTEALGNAGKFIAVSALSGAASVYDSAVTVTNWFGNDTKIRDNQEWITSLDQDLGQYYSENRQSADLAGFIGTALLPGIGGVKLLNAGQAALRSAFNGAKIGSNMSRATGILAPSVENYVTLAKAEITSQQAVFTTLNSNTIKALGTGVYQNILEGVAFESFVQATMFKSPILDDQDNWDIAKNLAVGGLLNGVIGGAVTGVGSYYKVSKARVLEDLRIKNQTARELVQEATSPSDKIILAAENATRGDEFNIPPLAADASAADVALYKAQVANSEAALAKRRNQIDLDNRTEMHVMNDGAPTEMINAFADTTIAMSPEAAVAKFHNAVAITRPNVVTKVESKFAADLDGAAGLTPVSPRWIKIAGEDAGQTLYEKPAFLELVDTVAVNKGGKIADAVASEVRDYGFKLTKLFDPIADLSKLSWKAAEARFIWAAELSRDAFKPNSLIGANDLPLLQRYLTDANLDFRVQIPGVGKAPATELKFQTTDDLKEFILSRKDYIGSEILRQRLPGLNVAENSIETTENAIARTIDVSPKYISGTRDAVDPTKGLFHTAEQTAAIHADRINAGLAKPDSVPTPAYFVPKTVKVVYEAANSTGSDGHILDALVSIKAKQKEYFDAVKRVTAKQAGGEISSRLEDVSLDNLMRTDSRGAGAGFVSFAQAAYGSVAATMQKVGGVSKELQVSLRQEVDSKIQAALYALKANPEASVEFSRINQLLTRTSEDYVFDTQNLLGRGDDVLVPKKIYEALKKAGDEGIDPSDIQIQKGAPEFIEFKHSETAAAFKAHTDLNSARQISRNERNSVLGKTDNRDPDIVRGIAPSPKDFPHFAFVVDDTVTGAGHSTMLFGNTPKELQDLIAKTNRDFPGLKIRTKEQGADYFRAYQQYDYSMGLNENYIDSALKREGIYSNFYTKTDPDKIVNDILQFHYKGADTQAADLVRLRYNDVFDWLENQAKSYSELETSKFGGGKIETIRQNEKNPYISYIKTALNLSSTPTSNPWWSFNKFIDDQGSKAVGRVRETFGAAKSPADLAAVNKILSESGSQTSFNSAAEEALINHTAPKAEISKFVRAGNSIMSIFTLGLDPLNAAVNIIGSNVLRATEITSLTRAINSGDEAIAGKLAMITKVKIPGVDDYVTSPAKLLASSVRRFFDPKLGPLLRAEYKAQGFTSTRLEQFASIADDLTLQGTETVAELQSRTGAAFTKAKEIVGKGEQLSGNNWAEEFNRFLSADSVRQITDLAIEGGHITKAEAGTYINNFVNRVEGNTIASQRPGLFQGPLGQAIGLFQTYQFNLLQNLFRYVGEGTKKDTAMLLGIQSTFFGLNGAPGFKLINDHIVGNLSGNDQHRDLYDITRGIAGKEGAEWLLYGTASNIMQTNVYSRGDINPRTVTIVPTSLAEIPFVGGASKVFGTLYETSKKLGAGGNVWETIRQGIEHNGVSRPLAGLAQVSRGLTGDGVFSTSSKGNIQFSNDLVSLATMSRIVGGKPLDEAIQNDTMFSIQSYEATDRRKKQMLAEVIKTTQIQGQESDENQVNQFAEAYSNLGGKQSGFAKYMLEQYKAANTTQAAKLAERLNNPLSYKIQSLMTPDGQQFGD